jgi:hypothetical protein
MPGGRGGLLFWPLPNRTDTFGIMTLTRTPDFFIVGAPKCGTTAMYTALRQHPDVFMPTWKEPHYFGFDHTRVNYAGMSAETYHNLFQNVGTARCMGEASTSYLHSSTAASEIKAFSPSARILILLRSPVDVMQAYHGANLFAGFEFLADFEEALAAEADRKRGLRWPTHGKGILETLFYREIVAYPVQIERYWRTFGKERVEVIIHDDYRSDPNGTYARVFSFLDIDRSYRPAVGTVNASRTHRSRLLQRALRHPPTAIRRLSRLLTSESVRRRLVRAVERINVRHSQRPPLRPELRASLQREVLPSIERLSAMLGRDLTGWCHKC